MTKESISAEKREQLECFMEDVSQLDEKGISLLHFGASLLLARNKQEQEVESVKL